MQVLVHTHTGTYTVVSGDTDRASVAAIPVSVVLTDAAGNSNVAYTTAPTSGGTVTVDANAPAAPVITSVATDNKINNAEKATIAVVGTAEALATVNISLTDASGTAVTGSAAANGGGAYTVTIDGTSLVDGAITASSTATDAAGNVSTATTQAATKDVVAPTLPVTGIIGSTIQGAGDQIVLTFDGPVQPQDGTWSANEIEYIKSPATSSALTLTNATFSPTSGATTTLTITLDEATDNAFLRNGNIIVVKPASNKIQDAAGNFVSNTDVTGTTANSGDAVQPTVALTYSPNRSLMGLETVTITATFSEAMNESTVPTVAMATAGDGSLSATNMTKSSNTVWTYNWQVPGGFDDVGTATATIVATDLAGNSNATASNNTRTITSAESIITAFTADSVASSTATLSVTTSESANCRYATSTKPYASMTDMATTGTTSHSQNLTGLTPSTTYNYYVRCSISSNAVSDMGSVSFTTTVNDSGAVLAVNSVDIIRSTMTASGTYDNGGSWKLHITVPTTETEFTISFGNWVGSSDTLATANNMRVYSAHSSNASTTDSAITITAADTQSATITLNADHDASTAGRQIDLIVDFKVPSGAAGGSYSTNYTITSSEPVR